MKYLASCSPRRLQPSLPNSARRKVILSSGIGMLWCTARWSVPGRSLTLRLSDRPGTDQRAVHQSIPIPELKITLRRAELGKLGCKRLGEHEAKYFINVSYALVHVA